ncbi:MAG: HEAT repeat domain-containing protein [Thermoanaerobaculaceae bacterium]|jgi:hypothetical protein|nr:HEAT repeat domain-containing protein [Thermoanaerobaculaceae bacterium]
MEPLLGLILVAVVAAPAMLWRWYRNQALADAWRTAASAPDGLGLEHVRSEAGVFSVELAGQREDLTVAVSRRRGGHGRSGRMVMAVSSPRRLGWHLSLSRESLGTQLNQLMGEQDIKTGDRVFDAAVAVYGEPEVLVATLDEPTRVAVRQALESGITVEGGRIERELSRAVPDPRVLVRTGKELLDLAVRLATPHSVPGKLAANAGRDADPAVRRRSLEVLIEKYGDRPEATGAARRALEDADPDVRLMAGGFLGLEGRPTLLTLAADPGVPEATAVAALEALGGAPSVEQLEVVLDQAAPAGRFLVARAAATALGRCRSPRVGAAVVAHLTSPDAGLAAAVARAMGASGDPSCASPLVAALGSLAGDVRAAAAEALGVVGTVDAVVPLRQVVGDHPLDLGLRRAALGAINAIQARLTGAAPGQLGLADGEAGTLSLAGPQAGDVTLVPGGEVLDGSGRVAGGPPEPGGEPDTEAPRAPVPPPGRPVTTC